MSDTSLVAANEPRLVSAPNMAKMTFAGNTSNKSNFLRLGDGMHLQVATGSELDSFSFKCGFAAEGLNDQQLM